MRLSEQEAGLLASLRASARPTWPDFGALHLEFALLPRAPSTATGTGGAIASQEPAAVPLQASTIKEQRKPATVASTRPPPTPPPPPVPPPPPPPPPPLSLQPASTPSPEAFEQMTAKVGKLVRGVPVEQIAHALRANEYNLSRTIDALKAAQRAAVAPVASRRPPSRLAEPCAADATHGSSAGSSQAASEAMPATAPPAMSSSPSPSPSTQARPRKRAHADGGGQTMQAPPPKARAATAAFEPRPLPPPRRHVVAVACDDSDDGDESAKPANERRPAGQAPSSLGGAPLGAPAVAEMGGPTIGAGNEAGADSGNDSDTTMGEPDHL